MAYDKIIPIRRRLDHCLAYAANEHKTDLAAALHYIGNERKTAPPYADSLRTGINCTVEIAYAEMQETKSRWNKCGGILGYHIIHSYAPGEVTPQEAHAAGVEFARRLLGERYEAVVATHLDREHLHCHIVFNSVSLVDGSKYRSDFKSYFGTLRGTSNAVSRERGLSVIEPEHEGRHYAEWDAEKHSRPTVRGTVRADVDAALLRARSFSDFLTRLRAQGYERLQATMRSRNLMATIILQNISQLKALFKDSWEGIIGNADAFLYLGGNEQSTHKYVSELLGKETIQVQSVSQSKGRSGSYSKSTQLIGRDLMTPDEVRMLDNRLSILLVRGEKPVIDEKYELMRHPNIHETEYGGAAPYVHHATCIYAVDDLPFTFETLNEIEVLELEESL